MIRRKDLVDVGDADYKERQGEFMQCLDCGVEIGGTRGDFFSVVMDFVFICMGCGSENIAIVKIVRKTVIVKQ